MPSNARHDEPLDRAIAEIQRMAVPAPPGPDTLLALIPAQSQPAAAERDFGRKRLAMRRVYQVATAAAAIIVLATGWLMLGPPATLAIAEVIEATTSHKVVRYNLETSAEIKMKTSAHQNEEEFVPATNQEVVYFDLTSPRFRIELHQKTLNGTVQSDWVTIQDNQRDRTLVMSSLALIVTEDETKDHNQLQAIKMFKAGDDAGKRARLFRVSDKGVKPFTNMKTDKTFLEILQAFQDRRDVVATQDVLDGRDSRKYRLDQPGVSSIVWVDIKTKLPIRIEQELIDPSPKTRRWKWVYSDFRWDVDVGNLDEFFSTTPPADYRLEDHTKDN
jgi:hypothetical protein